MSAVSTAQPLGIHACLARSRGDSPARNAAPLPGPGAHSRRHDGDQEEFKHVRATTRKSLTNECLFETLQRTSSHDAPRQQVDVDRPAMRGVVNTQNGTTLSASKASNNPLPPSSFGRQNSSRKALLTRERHRSKSAWNFNQCVGAGSTTNSCQGTALQPERFAQSMRSADGQDDELHGSSGAQRLPASRFWPLWYLWKLIPPLSAAPPPFVPSRRSCRTLDRLRDYLAPLGPSLSTSIQKPGSKRARR